MRQPGDGSHVNSSGKRASVKLLLVGAACVGSLGLAIGTAGAASAPPSVSTGAVSSVTPTSVVVAGVVNPHGTHTDWYFEYGTTTKYGGKTATKALVAGPNAVAVAEPIIGLAAQSTYHFRIVGTN